MAIFRRDSVVPSKVCSCGGVVVSAGGLALLPADVVALWVASSDKYRGTLNDVNVSGGYALPWIIRRGPAAVCMTAAAPCDLEMVKTRIVGTRLFACCLSAVVERQRVPGAVSSSGISFSSASRSVSDAV